MARPITEHSTKLRAGKGKRGSSEEPSGTASRTPTGSRVLEPVVGGRVRRIVFEGDPVEPAPAPERDPERWQPRHRASMTDIEFEVDNLGRFRARRDRTDPHASVRTGTVYETERGAVREARQKTERGERRVLYTVVRNGDRMEERRFSGLLVDEALRRRDAPAAEEEVVQEESVEYVPRTRRVVEEVLLEPRRRRDRKGKGNKAAGTGPATPEQVFQPQCAALTRDGLQCRNSSKTGTRYCGSHQAYEAQSLSSLADTKPRVAGAEDTLPGRGSDRTTNSRQAQCGAYTRDGLQCRNSSRRTSKYCAAHKGYRAPSRSQLEARLDTTPRHARAADTKPDLKG